MDLQTAPIERTTFALIRDLSRSLRLFQEGAVICADVTFSQFVILDHVRQGSSLRISELNELLGVEKSTTSRLIKPLVNKGLLLRDHDPGDRRSIVLRLSKQGTQVHEHVWDCFAAAVDRFFMAVPDNQRSHVVATMQLLSQAFFCCCGKEDCCR